MSSIRHGGAATRRRGKTPVVEATSAARRLGTVVGGADPGGERRTSGEGEASATGWGRTTCDRRLVQAAIEMMKMKVTMKVCGSQIRTEEAFRGVTVSLLEVTFPEDAESAMVAGVEEKTAVEKRGRLAENQEKEEEREALRIRAPIA
ncbi:unnamed protein product [Cuscuta campestris]|uniref:Uncharacterized protein n=1 Tax=Cuscuta campestris TaxID=132261 RepID=A0A484KGF0_9ASTE|nr:unnamed protein product [Cuscuta campestris]